MFVLFFDTNICKIMDQIIINLATKSNTLLARVYLVQITSNLSMNTYSIKRNVISSANLTFKTILVDRFPYILNLWHERVTI